MIETTIGISYNTKNELKKLMMPDEKWDCFLFEICQFIKSNQNKWNKSRQKSSGNPA